MTWNVAIKWIMLVSGLLTSTMIYAAIAPRAAMLSTFGEALDGPLTEIIVRNWGVLIALIGAIARLWGVQSAGTPARAGGGRRQ